jgi:hypothetical protein
MYEKEIRQKGTWFLEEVEARERVGRKLVQ